jgi:NAD(P)-dependent dehydrogenase (short-subunit alcohol dehydrogenase family)
MESGTMTGMLHGKVALVTGAARGIGRQAAIVFAREGASVIAADLLAAGVEDTVAAIRSAGGQAIPVVADVSLPHDVTAMVDSAIGAYGRLDCAFNNAGINGTQAGAGGKLTADWSEESFDKVIQVNLKGAWLCMRAEIEAMTRQGSGSIVNTASLAGLTGFRTTAAYAASKHGIVGLTKTAALDYAPQIRVNCVCPGWIDTDMISAAMARRGPEILAGVPFGRMGMPEDIAQMVCWLLSDRANYVTGAAFNVDGGVMAGRPIDAFELKGHGHEACQCCFDFARCAGFRRGADHADPAAASGTSRRAVL